MKQLQAPVGAQQSQQQQQAPTQQQQQPTTTNSNSATSSNTATQSQPSDRDSTQKLLAAIRALAPELRNILPSLKTLQLPVLKQLRENKTRRGVIDSGANHIVRNTYPDEVVHRYIKAELALGEIITVGMAESTAIVSEVEVQPLIPLHLVHRLLNATSLGSPETFCIYLPDKTYVAVVEDDIAILSESDTNELLGRLESKLLETLKEFTDVDFDMLAAVIATIVVVSDSVEEQVEANPSPTPSTESLPELVPLVPIEPVVVQERQSQQ